MARDWSGYKYTILKSLGLNVDMIFGYQPDGQSEMHFHLMSHEFHDGVGAIRKLCERQGFELPQIVVRKTRPQPTLREKLKRLRKHVANAPYIAYDWKQYDANAKGDSPSFHYALFDLPSSDAMAAYCKKNKIGETSLLLNALDSAATNMLLNRVERRSWILPHDFRRAIGEQKNTSNVTAPLNLLLSGEQTPKTIYRQMKELYREDILWGGWLYTNFSSYLPRWLISILFKRMKKPGWFGVFANMGRWESTNEEGVPGYWISAPPAAVVTPVTAGAFTWNGHTAFSLQCHASLGLEESGINALLQQWITVLEAEIAQPLVYQIKAKPMAALRSDAERVQ